jgi:hypothetical protein
MILAVRLFDRVNSKFECMNACQEPFDLISTCGGKDPEIDAPTYLNWGQGRILGPIRRIGQN